MAKLPKRAAKEHKTHALRLRTYARNLPLKAARKNDQAAREKTNRERGFTGKDIDNAMRKAYGQYYRQVRRNIRDGFSSWQSVIADVMTR